MFMWPALISQTPGACMSPWLASPEHWALSPERVAPGCPVPTGMGQFGFEGHLGCHHSVWGLVCQTPVSLCDCLPGYRLCDPPPGPSLPQRWITKGHFRVLVALSQPQPLGRGGSGLHSRSLAPTPALSLGHPCTSEKEGGRLSV